MTTRPVLPGKIWCGQCRRYHPLPVCADCGCELPDLAHRLIWLCDSCKSKDRAARATAQRQR